MDEEAKKLIAEAAIALLGTARQYWERIIDEDQAVERVIEAFNLIDLAQRA